MISYSIDKLIHKAQGGRSDDQALKVIPDKIKF